MVLFTSCIDKNIHQKNYDAYPTSVNSNLWLNYSKEYSEFKIWSPTAENVQLQLYEEGNKGEPIKTHQLELQENGIWIKKINKDLNGIYYTYQVLIDGNWLDETPGIYAKAVGVNGNRAMVLDFESTNPINWETDKGPEIEFNNEAIIYELQIRDITIHPNSGSRFPGKYLGLAEEGTTGPNGVTTGIDHIKEMGITHVHLLPTYDYYYIDETKLDSAQYNWGYGPHNYNVPEGSFSTNPYNAEVRIKEFKEMVKSFHDNGIGVILDVVYNHTGKTENSLFNLEVPDYYYRHWEDGQLSNASYCGNETASERIMMRKYILESVAYWAKEYHLDGFRFDLMAIHDITTMNEVVKTLKEINPSIVVYGEGWAATDSPFPISERASKNNTKEMSQISVFSDDIRDGLKGSVFEDDSTGFVSGVKNREESVKFGIVGSIYHSQINYDGMNISTEPWTNEPWQAVSYVSCHDNQTLYDKLKVSRKDADEESIVAMDKLANAIVMTSQGVAFIHAGAEMLRTKNGEHNSFDLPDSINQIDWNWKVDNSDVVEYYRNLIKLRKIHPAFRMTSADDVRRNLEFVKSESALISYQISNNANGDEWKNIHVIYNANPNPINYQLKGEWQIAVEGNDFYFNENKTVNNKFEVPKISMMVLYQK